MFSAIRSRNTTGISSSPPCTALVFPFMLLRFDRNAFTSSLSIHAVLVSIGRASKALLLIGRLRMLISALISFVLTFFTLFSCLSAGGSASKASSSVSSSPISLSRSFFFASCSVFSVSNFSTSSSTAFCSSSVCASSMAFVISASRVSKLASRPLRASSSFFFCSI